MHDDEAQQASTTSDAPRWDISIHSALTAAQLAAVEALAAAAEAADGNPPFSEQTLVELRTATSPLRVALASLSPERSLQAGDAEVVGAAVVILPKDGENAAEEAALVELAVHPRFRCAGVGGALADAVSESVGVGPVHVWSHGQHDGAARLAARHGLSVMRELWRMRLTGHETLPAAELPEGVRLRAFVPGHDELRWLSANAAAFADHPEQGSLTLTDLKARMAEDWFDPAGFFLAVDTEDRILGYHWTKVHAALTDETGQHAGIGEVYVVGVTPEAQGRGLGKALTIAGINHLLTAGLPGVMLYVDADNTAAVRLYQQLGFTLWDKDVMFGARGSRDQ